MSKTTSSTKTGADINRLQKASMAIEDLALLLRQLKPEYLIEASEALALLSRSASLTGKDGIDKNVESNKQYLIGVLPRLLQDKELFPKNEDIVDFAASALGLEMNRSEKRSRYEIIGKVICETDVLRDKELSVLVRALEKTVGATGSYDEFKKRKKSANFSWNETIQALSRS